MSPWQLPPWPWSWEAIKNLLEERQLLVMCSFFAGIVRPITKHTFHILSQPTITAQILFYIINKNSELHTGVKPKDQRDLET